MHLIAELLDSLTHDGPVSEVLVGARWTLVGGQAGWGMAGTRAEEAGGHGSNVIAEAGRLTHFSARQLAEMADSTVPLERSVGLAALNSLVDVDLSQTVDLNVSEYLIEHGRGRNMVVVGSFPFLDRLRPIPKRFWVLELSPGPDELPASAADQVIPQADVVAITSSTLLNQTLDDLLALCRPDAQVVLMGPSTPMSPIWFEHGVEVLAGVFVDQPTDALRTVGQGACFRQVRGVRHIILCKDRP
jgi:uncharacterized protein (DUF4213/DUF364 family)